MTMRDGHIPSFVNRVAAKDIGQHTGNVVTSRNKDKRPDGNMEVTAGKDAHVEKQHRDFQEASAGAVENRGDDITLSCQIARRKRISYLQKIW